MKLEQSEQLLVEEFFEGSIRKGKVKKEEIDSVYRLTGDASTRRYYRLFTTSDSFVICLDTPHKGKESSYPFYEVQSFLESYNIRVPKIYDIDLRKGYILEEDLGDQTFLRELANLNSIEEEFILYKRALDLLIQVHKIDYTDHLGKADFLKLKFDEEKFMFEFNFTIKYFLEKFLKVKITQDELKIIQTRFLDISKELSSYPMVITHRDYHSRNLMLSKKDLVMIDFQDARLGIPQYDLVSLLEDCYYRIHRTTKNRLIEHYLANMELRGQKDKVEFNRLYNLMAIQRIFKAIGSFSYIYDSRKDERYLKYIGYAMENMRTKLSYFDELNDLRIILSRYYYES